jgi:hypothetical protein
MTPEQARSLRHGLLIAGAYLRADEAEMERLLAPFVEKDNLPAVADAFIYAGLVAIDTAAYSRRLPFQRVLRDLRPLDDVTLLADLPVGPWDDALRLAGIAKRGGMADQDADQEPVALDVPSAINVTFRFAISALTDLTREPRFSSMTPAELTAMLAQGVEAGYGVDSR